VRIGLISDTHGLLRPEAARALQGCDAIVHAGDIGKAEILDALREIAPVHAIRGNNDTGVWAKPLPDTLMLRVAGVQLFVLHDFKATGKHPVPAGTQVVVCGHSHKPVVERQRAGFLLVNPGSAGPRRFKLPVSVALMDVNEGDEPSVRIVELPTDRPA
jgi:putative phosphoesterase